MHVLFQALLYMKPIAEHFHPFLSFRAHFFDKSEAISSYKEMNSF
jgi:hypothetical protein